MTEPHASLRLPLQIGTSSLTGFSRAAMTLIPGGLLAIGSFLYPIIFEPWDEVWSSYKEHWGTLFFLTFLGIAWLTYAITHLRLAFRERPSDILFSPDGIHLQGGLHSGLSITWSDLRDHPSRVRGRYVENLIFWHDKDDKKDNLWELMLSTPYGGEIVIASAEDDLERQSLEAIEVSINAFVASYRRDAQHEEERSASPQAQAIALFRCDQCDADLMPIDGAAVTCPYCGAEVAVPDDLRQRIHALHQRDAQEKNRDALVSKLLRQPGALYTTAIVILSAIPSLLVWPAITVVAIVLYWLSFLQTYNAFFLTFAALAAIRGLFYLARGHLTDRRAVRLLTLRFAARTPTQSGEPHTCRICHAPLIEPDDAVVVECVYCSAENILGLDLRGEAAEGLDEEKSLDEALAARHAEHRRWRWSGAIALLLLGAAGFFTSIGLRPPHEVTLLGHASDLTRVTYDPIDEFHPNLSPDGRKLLYTLHVSKRHRKRTIMLAPRKGAFRGKEMTRATLHAKRPVWLPNGRGFIYVSWSRTKKTALRRVDSLSPYASAKVLVEQHDRYIEPTISPDGQRLAYAALARKHGTWKIFVASIDGSHPVEITHGFTPAWSPRGDRIAFTRYVHHYRQIFVIHPSAGAKEVQLTSGSCHHKSPSWSPDAQRIAFISDCHAHKRRFGFAIYIMRADGHQIERLTRGDADVSGLAWSGHEIFFAADIAGNFDIWRIHIALPPLSPTNTRAHTHLP